MTKKLIAFVLAASLCIGSAFAVDVDVYEVGLDARPLMMMSNSGASTYAASDSWYDSVLQNLEWMMFDIDSMEDLVDSIYLDTGEIWKFLSDICFALGTESDTGTIFGYVRDMSEWLGVYDGGLQLNELLSAISSGVSSLSSSFGAWLFSWDSFSGLFHAPAGGFFLDLPTGGFYLDQFGNRANASSPLSISSVLGNLAAGLGSQFTMFAGNTVLGTNGSSTSLSSAMSLKYLISNSALGLSSNLKAISSGSYLVSLLNSDTAVSANSTASTMGAMIYQYLDSMQDDLGALTFIHADSEAVQAKKDAANNTVAVTDSFLKPGSVGSVGVSDIGDAAEAVSGTKDLFDTGVSIGQAFDQLQGSGPLEFFTAQTAANLNTVPATYSDDDDFVHFYDPSNSEFFELIGKGGD